MALDKLNLKIEYHTNEDDVINDFYIPCLQESVSYDRMTGFFSGIAFQMLAPGLSPLITNGGRMRLIISTRLSQQEEEAIKQGYDERDVLERNFLDRFQDPSDEFEKGYLSLLTYLIANNILDIRVAVIKNDCSTAMQHQKIGVFYDLPGNMVAFSGSGNETPSGLMYNLENFDVYCSWKGDDPFNRAVQKRMYFNQIWNGKMNFVHTYHFPEAVKEKLFVYRDYLPKEKLIELDRDYIQKHKENELLSKINALPSCGAIRFHDYQQDAISNLKSNGYRGYFDMATGTGKTYTALGGIATLVNDPCVKTKSFFCLIVVPYTHLAVQWEDDCRKFGIEPLLAFGDSKKWKSSFERKATSVELRESKFECVIITTASLMHDFVIEALQREKVRKRVIFVADEAHNLGAGKTSKILNIDFRYRIGLSATMDRHHDSIGTEKLYNFFGKCCIHYDLRRAIDEHHLSHYRYYPILVWFDEDELEKYIDLSKRISKLSIFEDPEDDRLKRLLLKRALIIAGCKMKVEKLLEVIKPFASQYYNLVYCGAVNYSDKSDGLEETQLKTVLSELHDKLGMTVERFTAQEDIKQRETIKEHFEKKIINALVAIKCLDEGVNIPCIQRAFILASSTNPKEYVQRRGRVLRLFDPREKPFAEIFDFVTISRPLEDMRFLSKEQKSIESKLVQRELTRVEEFSRLADNSADSNQIKQQIISAYDLDKFEYSEDDDE